MFCVDDQIDVLCVFKRRSLLVFPSQEGGGVAGAGFGMKFRAEREREKHYSAAAHTHPQQHRAAHHHLQSTEHRAQRTEDRGQSTGPMAMYEPLCLPPNADEQDFVQAYENVREKYKGTTQWGKAGSDDMNLCVCVFAGATCSRSSAAGCSVLIDPHTCCQSVCQSLEFDRVQSGFAFECSHTDLNNTAATLTDTADFTLTDTELISNSLISNSDRHRADFTLTDTELISNSLISNSDRHRADFTLTDTELISL